MNQQDKRIRVLYSFPHKLGADRICTTAWYQVYGLAKAGAEILVFPGALSRPLPAGIKINPTLSWGKIRIPYKVLGDMRAFSLHDYIVSQRLEKLAGQIDIVHTWPLGALRTLETAARLGIPTVMERPNAHTRFAYEVVQKECERLGMVLPPDHEHSYKEDVLIKEEAEYALATRLLCPSDFVARSFQDLGFSKERLARHQYGFDEQIYYSDSGSRQERVGLTMLFVGGCAPRKGVHYALEAWLKSTACHEGKFMIAGGFVPGYAEKLASMLSHPSVQVLGHRTDVPQLMRQSDILVLPSIEEGSALVTSEARGSGCVLLVSEAAGAICEHMENALVHRVSDVSTLTQHINLLQEDREFLQRLRTESLRLVPEITWNAAGVKLLDVYRETIAAYAGAQ
ncbi:glycosyltransferase family 4 protein [Methylobacter tundripaludum]|uniref:Glycosyl transferase group 1 n=1 Tax=Methylobacter tundripaludum (strain ATCC BAA-1195 / DSM 17260 / SV96) TaxID=697282 RepID=G3J0N5_METTV|nr:glycosyltransferase family 4 protein [Methylobacter tundripaludum]EGW20757.1 glycosyl transferase group 1 [Methylobacter tundripaludum SV96]